MRNLKHSFLWQIIRPHGWGIALLFVLGFSANGVSLSFPILLKSLVDAAALDLRWQNHLPLYGMVIAAVVGGFLVAALRDWMIALISAQLEKDLSSSVIDKLLTTPLASLRKKSDGEWLTALHQIRDLKWFIGQSGCEAVFDFFLVLGYCGVLYHYNASTAFIYLGVLLTVGISMRVIGKSIFNKVDRAHAVQCEAESRVVESLRNSLQVRAFQITEWSKARWARPFFQSVDYMRKADYQSSFFGSVFDLIHRASPVMFLAWKVPAVARGEMSWGTLLALSSTLTIGFDPLLRLIFFSTHYQRAARALKSLNEVWQHSAEVPKGRPLSSVDSLVRPVGVSFRNVSFGYGSNDKLVLAGINLNIAPGEWIGLAGSSGAGKSTLLSLLMRLHETSSGILEFGGQDITQIPLATLRSWVGVVEQESRLFEATLLENVAVGDPSPNQERAWECLELADAATFVRALPESIHTSLKHSDSSLSAGQKQRIALARAIYWNPRLLLLDEPTSALDGASERLIQRSLERVRQDRTVILSAHRLHTLKQCDRVVVLENGCIVEFGPHEELIHKKGHYSRMWRAVTDQDNILVPAFR